MKKTTLFNEFYSKLQALIFPFTCIFCQQQTKRALDLCGSCEKDLPWMREACWQCGEKLFTSSTICGACLQKPPVFDRTIALFQYEKGVAAGVSALKFQHNLIFARIFSSVLETHWKKENLTLPEVILPVPLHVSRLRSRGFNQAMELVKPLAKTLGLPIDFSCIERTRATQAQSLLSFDARAKNVKKAFIVKPNTYRHVAIFDDVVTTGETVNAIANALKQSGILRVEVWCLAKTPK